MAKITLKGNEVNTVGQLPDTGSEAPDFKLVASDLSDVSLANFEGKRKILNIVPSLDTGTCATSTKKFNDLIKQLDNTVVLVISADLPFAMNRFCDAEKIENVTTLSTMRGNTFLQDYGILIKDGPLAGVAARAVVVLDEKNRVLYTQLVPEITEEPDYDKALSAL